MINRAREIIEDITREAEVAKFTMQKLNVLKSMVLLLNCLPVKMLYYTSQISKERINKVEDVLSIGDSIE